MLHAGRCAISQGEDDDNCIEGTGHNRIDPRILGHCAKLGTVGRTLREERLQGDRAELPGLHLKAIIGELDSPPILMGHSAGGVFVQLLLDRGIGAVGVAMNSAPTEGVTTLPLSQIKSTFPVLKNPANRHKAVAFTHEQWHYAFTNTFTEEESRTLYERLAIPASGSILFGSVLANIQPGPQETYVNYRNDKRAPLLFISGAMDHLMPPAVQRSNANHYKSRTITEVKEFEGRSHLLPSQEGWEEVADYALAWAESHVAVMA
jgi:alpha-beta hydrolase superfamily lysophospholipase